MRSDLNRHQQIAWGTATAMKSMAKLVKVLSFLFVTQDVLGFCDLGKLLLRIRNSGSDVRMKFARQLFVAMSRLVTGIEDMGFQLIQEQDSLFLSGLFA